MRCLGLAGTDSWAERDWIFLSINNIALPGDPMHGTRSLRLRVFDRFRHPFAKSAKSLITITDGRQTQHIRDYFDKNDLTF
jgi:hypothetical protein